MCVVQLIPLEKRKNLYQNQLVHLLYHQPSHPHLSLLPLSCSLILEHSWKFPGCPVVEKPPSMQERQVQSLVGEQRSHMLQGQLRLSAAKNKKSLEKRKKKKLSLLKIKFSPGNNFRLLNIAPRVLIYQSTNFIYD